MNSADAWSDYWQLGRVTSFGDNQEGNYTGSIRDTWVQLFERIPRGSRILDLCTGNASIIRLIHAQCPERFAELEFVGVDYAAIPADELTSLSNVTLTTEVSIEQLPYDASSFDMVISNFGVEYSDFEHSLKEVARVLKPQGAVHFICHHPQSSVLIENRNLRAMLESLLTPDGPFDTLTNLLTCLNQQGKGERSEALRHSVNQQLQTRLETDEKALYASDFIKLLKVCFSVEPAKQRTLLDNYQHAMSIYIQRLRAMENAALTDERLTQLLHMLETHTSSHFQYETLEDNQRCTALYCHN